MRRECTVNCSHRGRSTIQIFDPETIVVRIDVRLNPRAV